MKSRSIRAGLALISAGVFALGWIGCGGEGGGPTPPSSVTVSVTPGTGNLSFVGETTQLTATVTAGPKTTPPAASWSSATAGIATVDNAGLVTAVANGQALIIASASGAADTATITVDQVATSVQVTSTSDTLLAFGETKQYAATALDQGGTAIPGQTFAWNTTDPGVATVDGNGLATAVGNGDADVTATADGVTNLAPLVVAQQVAGVTVTPNNPTIAPGTTQQFTAAAVDANANPVAGITFLWLSSNPAVATVDTTGLATGWTQGEVTITAAARGVPGNSVLSVANMAPRAGDIVIYQIFSPWQNGDSLVLGAAPFNWTEGTEYQVRNTLELKNGIPSSTAVLILTSAATSADSQIRSQNDPAAVANLEGWVRGGGWLVAHAADNGQRDYIIPGLLGTVEDSFGWCNGMTLTVSDHALIRGPDATLGTADDLTDANVDYISTCSEVHGHLNGILPHNAEVLIKLDSSEVVPVYATYPYGDGRVIVTSITLEVAWQPGIGAPELNANHYYWAFNGLNAGPAPGAPFMAAPVDALAVNDEWINTRTRRKPERRE